MTKYKFTLLILFSILLNACASTQTLNSQQVMGSGIDQLKQTETNVYASGQPTREQLKQLSESGVKNIVSLRPDQELDWNEQEYVMQLGMQYHHIPVAGADDITVENASLLQQTLTEIGNESVLVHCGSGNRVGALAAIIEFNQNDKNIDAAVSEGQRWGLTKLEPTVRSVLKGDGVNDE